MEEKKEDARWRSTERVGKAVLKAANKYKEQDGEAKGAEILEAFPIDLAMEISGAVSDAGFNAQQSRIFCLIMCNELLNSLTTDYDGTFHRKYLEEKNAAKLG